MYADDGDAADEESVAADVQFIAVSTSTQLSCGLLWNGVTVCWSFLTDTDLAISNPGCMMEAVASDGYVSCGRLLRSGLVPSSDEKERELAAAAERTHQNTTFFGLSDTGVFCWQSFPESFIGLERPTETWSLDERRVPLGACTTTGYNRGADVCSGASKAIALGNSNVCALCVQTFGRRSTRWRCAWVYRSERQRSTRHGWRRWPLRWYWPPPSRSPPTAW